MTFYDTIGNRYAQTRKRDPRITTTLLEILNLPLPSTVVDIGAGTGSYALALAEQGYQVLAVEPSAMMRNQATDHPLIQRFDRVAKNLPFPNQSADAAIVMLAFHHFQDYRKALEEAHRVTGSGRIVLSTYDPEYISRFWLTRYFPCFITDVQSTFLPIQTLTSELERTTNTAVKVMPFPLPADLQDFFAAIGWARPELYLEQSIRNGISSFDKFDQAEIVQGLLWL